MALIYIKCKLLNYIKNKAFMKKNLKKIKYIKFIIHNLIISKLYLKNFKKKIFKIYNLQMVEFHKSSIYKINNSLYKIYLNKKVLDT